MPVTQLSMADTVRHLRENRTSMSARALSIAAGLSESYVGKVEAGSMDPSFRAFSKIAQQLRMTPQEIYVLVAQAARK